MLRRLLQLKGDVRMIHSRVFKAEHSLRFPRVTRVRWDKSPRDCFTHQQLLEDVARQSMGGAPTLPPDTTRHPELSLHDAISSLAEGNFTCRKVQITSYQFFA